MPHHISEQQFSEVAVKGYCSFGLFFVLEESIVYIFQVKIFPICNVPCLCVWRCNWKGATGDSGVLKKMEVELKYARSNTE